MITFIQLNEELVYPKIRFFCLIFRPLHFLDGHHLIVLVVDLIIIAVWSQLVLIVSKLVGLH